MIDVPSRVLLIEDNVAEAGLVQAALAKATGKPFRVEWVSSLAAALKRLAGEEFEVILLDFSLPDGRSLDVFKQVFQEAPNSVFLVLCSAEDEAIARQAVQRGAEDYLVKGHVDAHWLPRALHYLIERKAIRDALRASEARFRAISDASPLGIFVSDLQGGCVYTNVAYHKISGLSFDQALGTNWATAIHPDDRQRVLAEWRYAGMGWEPFQTEYRFLQEDGSIVWTRVSSAPMYDGTHPYGRVKTVEDITQRKVAELALQAAEDALFDERER
ncbi:MAG TPA: PAS domain S-box protein, partial [Azonexus sp.]|nr:PAS domain S-box protein [Azonexus sp.]